MEMEKSTLPPRDLRLAVEEENVLTSQVLEITLQTLDQPKETEVWFMEDGDDSVFYSDEDQAHQDIKSNTSCDFGAKKIKCPVNSEAGEEPILQRESDPGADAITDKENVEMEKEVSQQFILAKQDLWTPKTENTCKADSAEPLQPNCTNADMQTQPKLNISSETAYVKQSKEGKAFLETQTSNIKPFHMSSEASYTRLNGEEKVPEKSSAKLQTTGNRQLEVDEEPEQDHNFHVPVRCQHDPSPGYSTLPLLKKSGHSDSDHDAFDHLTSSKYGTVSYRRIRKGNTRQKIEEFENMIIHL